MVVDTAPPPGLTGRAKGNTRGVPDLTERSSFWGEAGTVPFASGSQLQTDRTVNPPSLPGTFGPSDVGTNELRTTTLQHQERSHHMATAVIVDAVRTAGGKRNGQL